MLLVYRESELYFFWIKFIENYVSCLLLFLEVPNKKHLGLGIGGSRL
jgi:hypothetical protein